MRGWSERSIWTVKEMRRKGMTLSEIASYFGRSTNSIEGVLRRYGGRMWGWRKI